MKVILYGATGMVGQGVLRECLGDAEVEEVLVVGRSGCGVEDAIAAPLFPVLKALSPRYVTTTEQVGLAMLSVAKNGHPTPIVENEDIHRLG